MKFKITRVPLLFLAASLLVLAASLLEGEAGEAVFNNNINGLERRGRVLRYKLDNGLTVINEQNNFSPVVALMVWVKAGSAVEQDGEYGLAHVHEHMLFKGTEKRGLGQVASEVEAAGGDINAYTSFDETVYYIVMPSRHVELGLDILSDVIFNSSFDPDEMQKELQVVLEEIKRGYDNPMTMLSHALFKKAYKVHSYGRPIIGTEESVRSFTREKVLNFYGKWYTPENMVLVAVGDFDNDKMAGAVNRYFNVEKRKSRKKSKAFVNIPPEPKQRSVRSVILRSDISEGYLEMAFHIPNINGEDIPALDILSYILGSGESSRLYRKVQSKMGLVHNVHSYTFSPFHPGLAIIGAALDPDKIADATEAILAEAARLKSEPPGTEEISRAKANIESESVYSRETVQGEARKLGYYEVIAGDIDFEEKYLRAIDHVSARDVMRVAREYFVPENITVALNVPKSAKIDGFDDVSIRAIVQKALEAPKNIVAAEGVEKYVLPNGLTVLVKEYHAVPVVAYRMAMLGGVRLEPAESRGISHFITRTVTKGTAKRSASDIASEVESLAGNIGGFSGRDSMGVQAEFLSKNYARGFDIFEDIVLNPTFVSKEIEQQRREILSDIRRIMDRPDSLTIDLFRKTLFKSHPYGSKIYGEEETISAIKRRDLVNYYRDKLIPGNMVLSVVGDVSAEEVMARVERAFGDMPARSPSYKVPRKAVAPTKIREVQVKRDKAQSQIVLGFLGPKLGSEDRYAMDVLANILGGQGGRLFYELRDKRHLAYAVGAVSVEALDAGMFFLYMGTRPENRNEALNGMMEEIRKITESPPSAEELYRAKEYLAGSYEIGLQTVASQATNLALNECYGLGWKESEMFPERIRSVTAEDVSRVAGKYLKVDRYVLAELVPEGVTQDVR